MAGIMTGTRRRMNRSNSNSSNSKSQFGAKPRMVNASSDKSMVTVMNPDGSVKSRSRMKISK